MFFGNNNSALLWWVFVATGDVLYPEVNLEVVMGSKVSSKMAAPAARVIQVKLLKKFESFYLPFCLLLF